MDKEFSRQEKRDCIARIFSLTLQSMNFSSELTKTFNGQRTAYEEMVDLKIGRTNLDL